MYVDSGGERNTRMENVILITISVPYLCKQTKTCRFDSHCLCFTCTMPIINVRYVLLSNAAGGNNFAFCLEPWNWQ